MCRLFNGFAHILCVIPFSLWLALIVASLKAAQEAVARAAAGAVTLSPLVTDDEDYLSPEALAETLAALSLDDEKDEEEEPVSNGHGSRRLFKARDSLRPLGTSSFNALPLRHNSGTTKERARKLDENKPSTFIDVRSVDR
jgi:hypothetical protein